MVMDLARGIPTGNGLDLSHIQQRLQDAMKACETAPNAGSGVDNHEVCTGEGGGDVGVQNMAYSAYAHHCQELQHVMLLCRALALAFLHSRTHTVFFNTINNDVIRCERIPHARVVFGGVKTTPMPGFECAAP